MVSYVDSNLIKDETVLHRGTLSLWALSGYIVPGILLIPFFGIGLVLLLVAYIKYKTTELAVTNKRVIAKVGFISRETIELNLSKTESIQINQSLLGRIFNYGSLSINGTGSSHAPISGIREPLEFRRQFMEAQDQASHQRSA